MAGNQGNNKIVWQDWQLEYLKLHWKTQTAQQLSDALGIKRTKVREKKYELGLLMYKLEYWTPEQIAFLKDNYHHMGDTEIAKIFDEKYNKAKGWTKKHIEKKRRYLKLKRTKQEMDAIRGKHKKNGVYALGNKKMWQTRGKADEREVRYWRQRSGRAIPLIKINGHFIAWARWRWEQLYGAVPKGMNVIFKDNDAYNMSDDNLGLLSDADLAKRNAVTSSQGLSDNYVVGMMTFNDPELRDAIKEYSPQLIELKRRSLLLKRTIKNGTTKN